MRLREQFMEFLRDAKATCKVENLFKTQMEDQNYELSPFVNFFVMKLSCQYHVMNQIYRYLICFTLTIITVEYGWILVQNFSLRQKIRYFVFRYIHLYGLTMAATVLATRHRIIEESHKVKQLQWNLSWISQSTRKVIGYRGLLQSVTLEICFVWVVAYTAAAYQVLDGTLLMSVVTRWRCPFLTRLMYLVECVVASFCIFYISIIPHICIYFAIEAQVQTLLLSEYVRKLGADSKKLLKCQNLNHKVHDSLRKILDRQLQLKRLYLDNRSLITTVGLIYVIPGTMSFAFNLYEFAEHEITNTIFALNTVCLVITTMYTMLCGQFYEDEWRRYYYELCKLPWYEWDRKNQRDYRLILTGSSKIMEIVIISHFSVNFKFLLQIFKYIYSATNAARNIYRTRTN